MNRISKIKRYIKKRMAYVDEDRRVWERHNEYEYCYNGLYVRQEMKDRVGKDIEKEDMVIVFNVIDGQFSYKINYKGVVIKRKQYLENLLI